MFNVSESPLSDDDSLSIRNYHMPICLIKKQQLQTYIDTLTVDQLNLTVLELDFLKCQIFVLPSTGFDTLQHQSLSLKSSALDHSTTSISRFSLRDKVTLRLFKLHFL
jgi:hypothetical protein